MLIPLNHGTITGRSYRFPMLALYGVRGLSTQNFGDGPQYVPSWYSPYEQQHTFVPHLLEMKEGNNDPNF